MVFGPLPLRGCSAITFLILVLLSASAATAVSAAAAEESTPQRDCVVPFTECDGALAGSQQCSERDVVARGGGMGNGKERPAVLLLDSTFNELTGICDCKSSTIKDPASEVVVGHLHSFPIIRIEPFLKESPESAYLHSFVLSLHLLAFPSHLPPSSPSLSLSLSLSVSLSLVPLLLHLLSPFLLSPRPLTEETCAGCNGARGSQEMGLGSLWTRRPARVHPSTLELPIRHAWEGFRKGLGRRGLS